MADLDPNVASDLSDATPQFTGPTPATFAGSVPSSNPGIVQDVSAYQNTNSNIEVLQFPLDQAKFFFVMSFQEYSRASLLDVKSTLNTMNQIHLPVPLGIMDTHVVEYKETPLNPFIGTGMNAAYKGIKNAQANGLSAWDVLGNYNSRENAASTAFSMAAGQALQSLPSYVTDPAKVALGYSPNQFFTILLKGPQYKQHSFTWHLVPKNYDESLRIQHIIRHLNNAAAPGLEWDGAIFSFPMVVQCAFWPNWNYLFRFKPAVIQRVSFNYTPNNGQAAFYHDGDTDNRQDHPPESVVLTIDFLELEYWLKNDFTGIGPEGNRSGDAIDVTASADERSRSVVSARDFYKKYVLPNVPTNDRADVTPPDIELRDAPPRGVVEPTSG